MDYVNFHCKNCNSATPEMCDFQTISNITHIKELRKIINSNLLTYVRHDQNCKNCTNIKKKLIDFDNYEIIDYGDSFRIYNIELIKEHGLFAVYCDDLYYRKININNWTRMDEKEFFDSIKVGSLLRITESSIDIIDKIKEKFYENNVTQIKIILGFHYYLIESPTLTKPARKK